MKENSLLVPNISKEQVIEMGLKYEQESVIFGEKKESQEGYYFEWSYIQGEKTIQNRKISFSGMGIQDRNDFYSLVKSRKFIIPFFDDKHISSKQKEYPKNQKDKVKSKQDSIWFFTIYVAYIKEPAVAMKSSLGSKSKIIS